jgi:TRAP-type C4-dicarboxylate transport system permease small subunit
VTDDRHQGATRIQRILAFTSAGLVILSLVCFFILIIGTWLGAGRAQSSGKGVWPTVELLPLVALPLAMLLIMALLVVSLVGRSRENRRNAR